jgi:hypothetical protein
MNMKNVFALVFAFFAVGCAWAQNLPPAPKWQATLKIVDDDGHPVPKAETWVSYYIAPPPGETSAWAKITGLTDTNGLFTASHRGWSEALGFHVQKDGYYPTSMKYELGFPEQYSVQKWNPSLTLILKKIGQPIPMYAKWVNLGIPVIGKPVGFDLAVGDWIAPHGKGKTTDMLFTAQLDQRAELDFDYKLTVSFPNSGDGIQEFKVPSLPVDQGSSLRSPHEAPAEGYLPQWIQTRVRKPRKPEVTNRDLNRNFFFRVRTVLDEKGNIKSACYGKIYGDFMNFRYFLNPEPNSRNVEFDPQKNLLIGLPFVEQVRVP